MAAIATERHRYTVSEFLALAAELERAGAQEWFEIVEGELVAYASPDNPHMRAAMACLKLLLDAQWAGYGQAGNDRIVVLDYQAPAIPVRHAYKLDAFFVRREREAILEQPGVPSVIGTPDIVVEVLSPTTARHDRPPRGKKFKAYEQYGVSHYWLVDTRRRTIATYERQGAAWWRQRHSTTATRCAVHFPPSLAWRWRNSSGHDRSGSLRRAIFFRQAARSR